MTDFFADKLIRLRASKGLTQRELAAMAGVSWSQISKYESGKSKPRKKVLWSLEEALGVSAGELQGSDPEEAMTTLILEMKDEPDYPFTVRKADLETLKGFADQHHVSLNAMLIAALRVAKDSTEGKEPDLEDALRDAKDFLGE